MCKVLAVVSVLLLMLSDAATATNSPNQVSATAPSYASISPLEQSVITRTTLVALKRLSQARSSLHRMQLEEARYELGECRRLTETIRSNLSAADARALIGIAIKYLEYEPPTAVLREIPAIRKALENDAVYLPTDKAINHLARAESLLSKGEAAPAGEELQRADRTLMTISIEEPLFKAETFMDTAQRFMDHRDREPADAALKGAEDQVRTIYTIQGTPLAMAEHSLWQAYRNYSSGQIHDAWTDLEQSRHHLNRAEAMGLTGGKKEVNELSSSLGTLEVRLIRAGDKPFQSSLKATWEQCRALTERLAAFLAAGVSEDETTLSLTGKLIHARLHVNYAESYQVVTQEPERAIAELTKAESFLRQAMKDELAIGPLRSTLQTVVGEVADLKSNPQKFGPHVEERYEEINFSLNDLIRRG